MYTPGLSKSHWQQTTPTTTFRRTQSAVSSAEWRSPSCHTISSPESLGGEAEEDMDLDTSEEHHHSNVSSTTFLWSMTTPSDANCYHSSSLNIATMSIRSPATCAANAKRNVDDSCLIGSPSQDDASVACQQQQLQKTSSHIRQYAFDTAEMSDMNNAQSATGDDLEDSGSSVMDAEDTSSKATVKDEGAIRNTKISCSKCCRILVLVSVVVVAVLTVCIQLELDSRQQCIDTIDVSVLRHTLLDRVYGQHIAIESVVSALSAFNEDRSRPTLVMLFHGWTGVGKNYMSHIISEHLSSSSVHKLIVPLHFARGSQDEARDLSHWILSNMTSSGSCRLRLFIIDEVDKTSAAIIESLHQTLVHLSVCDHSTDCHQRAIFLLLSNDGATKINSVLSQVMTNGESRDSVGLNDLEPSLSSQSLTAMIDDDVINLVVPFLPLQPVHVIQCIEAELKVRRLKITQDLINNILEHLHFFPADSKLFVKTGCRKISYLVDLVS